MGVEIAKKEEWRGDGIDIRLERSDAKLLELLKKIEFFCVYFIGTWENFKHFFKCLHWDIDKF